MPTRLRGCCPAASHADAVGTARTREDPAARLLPSCFTQMLWTRRGPAETPLADPAARPLSSAVLPFGPCAPCGRFPQPGPLDRGHVSGSRARPRTNRASRQGRFAGTPRRQPACVPWPRARLGRTVSAPDPAQTAMTAVRTSHTTAENVRSAWPRVDCRHGLPLARWRSRMSASGVALARSCLAVTASRSKYTGSSGSATDRAVFTSAPRPRAAERPTMTTAYPSSNTA